MCPANVETGMSKDASALSPHEVYRRRFGDHAAYRQAMWQALCQHFFQAYVKESDVVLDVAAGHCEFINHIRATGKIAVDINPETKVHAASEVRVFISPTTAMDWVDDGSVDTALVSNYFEHISKKDIVATLSEILRVLRPGGQVLILQPNIRFVYRDYWMFFDHVTPIDDRALCEALSLQGFEVKTCYPRFLPYTTSGSIPRWIWPIKYYLKCRLLWRVFGGQAFIHAIKS